MWFADFQEAPPPVAKAWCKKRDGAAAGRIGRGFARRVVGALLLVLLPVLAIGCDEATEPEATTAAPSGRAAKPGAAAHQMARRSQQDDARAWLASRQAKCRSRRERSVGLAIGASLSAAADRFRDPPRMIANRAVQLEEMLASEGITETAPELIDALSSAAGSTAREGFGAICQHYFILRKQGLGRDAALEQLKGEALIRAADPTGRRGLASARLRRLSEVGEGATEILVRPNDPDPAPDRHWRHQSVRCTHRRRHRDRQRPRRDARRDGGFARARQALRARDHPGALARRQGRATFRARSISCRAGCSSPTCGMSASSSATPPAIWLELSPQETGTPAADSDRAPAWFAALVSRMSPRSSSAWRWRRRLPARRLSSSNRSIAFPKVWDLGTVVIAGDADEIAEVWQDVSSLALVWVALDS